MCICASDAGELYFDTELDYKALADPPSGVEAAAENNREGSPAMAAFRI